MRLRARPAAILTDIEGTTTPIAFVRDELFPFARARLPDFLREHTAFPEADAAIAEAEQMAVGRPVLQALLDWMDADAKVTPLKTLQGLIWEQGYRDGDLTGRLYPDVAPALREWHAAGILLFVYSSGSETAQRLIFGHSDAGDLSGLFAEFFDTRLGHKRESASYAAIAARTGILVENFLFLSDITEELDAAADAGMSVCQLIRPEDGTIASGKHAAIGSFSEITLPL